MILCMVLVGWCQCRCVAQHHMHAQPVLTQRGGGGCCLVGTLQLGCCYGINDRVHCSVRRQGVMSNLLSSTVSG
jgi:hypothetical protein